MIISIIICRTLVGKTLDIPDAHIDLYSMVVAIQVTILTVGEISNIH